MGRRIWYLDLISGLFILQIVLMHILQWSGLWGMGTFFDYWDKAFFFFMPWFYFKAGLFLNRKRTLKEWIKCDFFRLLLPYAVFSVIGSLIWMEFDIWEGEKPLWKIPLSPLAGVVVNGAPGGNMPLWFLFSLFWSRLLFRIVPERGEIYAFVVAVAAGAVLSEYRLQLPFSFSTAFPGLAFLLLGKWSRNYVVGDKKVAGGGIYLLLAAYVACVCFFSPFAGMRLNQFVMGSLSEGLSYLMIVLLSWIGCLTISFVIRLFPFRIWLLEYLGKDSMLFYVVHWIPLLAANKLLLFLFPALDAWLLFVYSLVMVSVVLLICVSFRLRGYIPAWCLGEKKVC